MSRLVPLFSTPTVAKARNEFSVASFGMTQKRLPKYRRTKESMRAVANRRITGRSLEIIANLDRYHILPTSLIVPLVGGNQRIVYKHLQTLYHRNLVNRFSFSTALNPGEFHYYLDNPTALDLLVEAGWQEPQNLGYKRVRYNRENRYADINFDQDRQGSLLFLKHEVMISRFHTMLELGCRASRGEVELSDWRQGPDLWHSVMAPRMTFSEQRSLWGESAATEKLPHRPDAFLTLRFPGRPEPEQQLHFFYEADRKTTTNRNRIVRKLRAHYQYIVAQKKHQMDYG